MRTGTNLRSLERAATAALAMDRINEMYLEDPPSERDLYNSVDPWRRRFTNLIIIMLGISGIIDR